MPHLQQWYTHIYQPHSKSLQSNFLGAIFLSQGHLSVILSRPSQPGAAQLPWPSLRAANEHAPGRAAVACLADAPVAIGDVLQDEACRGREVGGGGGRGWCHPNRGCWSLGQESRGGCFATRVVFGLESRASLQRKHLRSHRLRPQNIQTRSKVGLDLAEGLRHETCSCTL